MCERKRECVCARESVCVRERKQACLCSAGYTRSMRGQIQDCTAGNDQRTVGEIQDDDTVDRGKREARWNEVEVSV